MSGPTDEELARRVRTGDEAALQALYQRYAPLLRARARPTFRGPLRRRMGASDVMQEAWISTLLRLKGFEDRGPGSFRAWLLKIFDHKLGDQVRNHVATRRRSMDQEASRGAAPVETAWPDRGPTPSQHAERTFETERVARAMAGLPRVYQDVLRLVHLQGLTLGEAGEYLGRSANAMCKVYGRALARLQERLGAARGD